MKEWLDKGCYAFFATVVDIIGKTVNIVEPLWNKLKMDGIVRTIWLGFCYIVLTPFALVGWIFIKVKGRSWEQIEKDEMELANKERESGNYVMEAQHLIKAGIAQIKRMEGK